MLSFGKKKKKERNLTTSCQSPENPREAEVLNTTLICLVEEFSRQHNILTVV